MKIPFNDPPTPLTKVRSLIIFLSHISIGNSFTNSIAIKRFFSNISPNS